MSAPSRAPRAVLADVVLALGTDRVDLARLRGASGLFRYRVARDGEPVYEAREGVFATFWMQAVTFWCDAEPVLRPAYDAVLAEYR